MNATATLSDNKAKVAYFVRFKSEATAIVFATSGVAARRLGAQEMDVEFEDVTSCCRQPDLDKYAAKGQVDPETLIEEHGFGFECQNCYGKLVDQRNEARCYDEFGDPFCSLKCRGIYQSEK